MFQFRNLSLMLKLYLCNKRKLIFLALIFIGIGLLKQTIREENNSPIYFVLNTNLVNENGDTTYLQTNTDFQSSFGLETNANDYKIQGTTLLINKVELNDINIIKVPEYKLNASPIWFFI